MDARRVRLRRRRRRSIASPDGPVSARCSLLGGSFVARWSGRASRLALVLAAVGEAGSARRGVGRVGRARPQSLPAAPLHRRRRRDGRPLAPRTARDRGALGRRRRDRALTWAASPLRWPSFALLPAVALTALLAPLIRMPIPRPERRNGAERPVERKRSAGEPPRRERDRLPDVSFRYPDAPRSALRGSTSRSMPARSCSSPARRAPGSRTLLRAANGLVPHASGGQFSGDVVAFGRSTRAHKPRELADVVGFVHQDPEAQFVVDHVERDLAFVLENLGHAPQAMRRRVEEVLDALGIAHLRERAPSSLSGGERQRCAIAGALAAAPAALVLDEPTSQLDPQGADDVLAADRPPQRRSRHDRAARRAPPRAGRATGRSRGDLRIRLDRRRPPARPSAVLAGYAGAPTGHAPRPPPRLGAAPADRAGAAPPRGSPPARTIPPAGARAPTATAPGESCSSTRRRRRSSWGADPVLADVSLSARRGEVVALLGRNGAARPPCSGCSADCSPRVPGAVAGPGTVAYVPQDPNTLLFAPTVRAELTETLHAPRSQPTAARSTTGSTRSICRELADRHPRSLAGGERQRVAVAAVAVGGADVLLLDEPTRGMDAPSRAGLEQALHAHAAGRRRGGARDPRRGARGAMRAARAVVLGDGDVVASGPAREVLAGSLFAPQVLRVLPPFLTVDEVADAASRSDGRV